MDHLTRLVVCACPPLLLAASPALAQDNRLNAFSLAVPAPYGSRLLPPDTNKNGNWSAGMPRVEPVLDEPLISFLPGITGAGKSREKGFSFGLRPGKSMKAVARLRF